MALFNFLNRRSWFLSNNDTGQLIQGQFEPQELTRDVKSNYGVHTALSRQKPIIQFLNGEAERLSFKATLFDESSFDTTAEEHLETLEEWTRRSDTFGRPALLTFWVGDGHVQMLDCVLESLGGISYGRPSFFGGLKQVTLTITLLQYEKYSIEDKGIFETRFHRARVRDYYEIICQREYGSAILGDVIRKRHPTLPNLQVGDVVKLPSIQAIRTENVKPTSLVFAGAYAKKSNPNRTLRLAMFDKRNRSHVSHIVKE